MKKVLAIALIAGAMVACNNNSDKKAEKKDSTVVDTTITTKDTTVNVQPMDTTAMKDTMK
jgi:hypothetical protein